MAVDSPRNKAEFQAHLRNVWTLLQATLDSLTEEQMTERTDAAGWTVTDHVGHLAVWEQGIIALLKKEPRYEAMGLDAETVQGKDEDELNQILLAKDESPTLAEVRDRLRRTHDELSAIVDSLQSDELLKGYSHFQPNEPGDETGEPVLRWVIGNSSGHYLEHLPWIQRIAGGDR